MRISPKVTAHPNTASVSPEIMFELEVLYEQKREIPVSFFGEVYCQNRKVSDLCEGVSTESNQPMALAARSDYNQSESTLRLVLASALDDRTVSFLQSSREGSAKGDIDLKLSVMMRYIQSRMGLCNLIPSSHVSAEHQLSSHGQQYDFALLSTADRQREGRSVFAGDGSSTLVDLVNQKMDLPVTIKSSDWVHDYSPAFGLGRYAVIEYPLPPMNTTDGSLSERLNKAIESVACMRDSLVEGEWTDVMEKARPVGELLRNLDELKNLLMQDGFTDQAAEDMNTILKALFELTSKFHHKTTKDNRLKPDMKPSKEDAHMMYAVAANVVNMIAQKQKRLGPEGT